MFYIQLLNTRIGCLVDEVKVNDVLTNCLQCGDIEDKEHWVNKVHKVHGEEQEIWVATRAFTIGGLTGLVTGHDQVF